MELIINLSVIGFTVLIAIIVERFMYRTAPTDKRIMDYQKELDEKVANAKAKWNVDWEYNALDEIMKERKMNKCFTLIFSGFFMAFVVIGSMFLGHPSYANIIIICGSGIILIIYGSIKITESKKLAIIVLALMLVIGTVCICST